MLDTTRNSYCSGVSQLPQNSQKNYSTAQTSSRGRAERCDRERNTMASFGGVEASNKAARTTVDVVIVGGGLSGLCAARLLAPGLSFLVLEANEHRFGGRLRNADVTHYASALRIDMGAAWVWPQVQPNMRELLLDLNLQTFQQPGLNDGTARIVGGTFAIIDAILATLPKNSLRLGWVLSSIVDERDPSSISGPILLRSDKGEEIGARAGVILAVPPKLLHESVTFSPPLPKDHWRAMANSRTWMAGVTKVSLIFASGRFWPLSAANMVFPNGGTPGCPAFQVYDGGGAEEEGYVENEYGGSSGACETQDPGVLTFFCLDRCDVEISTDIALAQRCGAQLAEVWSSTDYSLNEQATRLRCSVLKEPEEKALFGKTLMVGTRLHEISIPGESGSASPCHERDVDGSLAQTPRTTQNLHHTWARIAVQRWPRERFIADNPSPVRVEPHPRPVHILGCAEWRGRLAFCASETDRASPGVMEGAVSAAKKAVSDLCL